MIISYKHHFIFLKTQKCAGTSVEMALSTICGPDDVVTGWGEEDKELQQQLGCQPQNCTIPERYRPRSWRLRKMARLRKSHMGLTFYNHMPASKVRQCMDPLVFDAFRKVTIVRNPWDREVSLYFWKFRASEKRPPFERYVRWPRHRPERKTFELYSIDGIIVADTVLRYETLQDDFSKFTESLGGEAMELPRAKSNFRPKAKRDFHDFYNPTTRDVVARRYAREIEAFGYEF